MAKRPPPPPKQTSADDSDLAGTVALGAEYNPGAHLPSPPVRPAAGQQPPAQTANETAASMAQNFASGGGEEQAMLRNAPAAVQAAAEQALAAHRAQSPQRPAPPPRKPPPRRASAQKAGPSPTPAPSPQTHESQLKPGTVIANRYRVEELIGRGGMGTVYGVTHNNTGESLALKLLHPALAENDAAVERFRTEVRAPVRIGSEHVVRVVDADVSPQLKVPFMVMERLDGFDLRSELKRRGALPAGEVVLYLRQVARALDKAHNKGIIHRDLKPANLYLLKREDGSPLVKVLDFGIAKLTDDAAKELTVAGQVFGTPWYMAPEQARGDVGKVGPGTDLWALGLIAYQLLTGRNFWTADGMAGLIAQICYEPMPAPSTRAPHLGPLFDIWFGRACNREPSERFPTAKELVDELASTLGVVASGDSASSVPGGRMDSSLQLQIQMSQSQPIPGTSLPGTPNPATSAGAQSLSDSGNLNAKQGESTNNPMLVATRAKKRSGNTKAIAIGVGFAAAMSVAAGYLVLGMESPTPNSQPAVGATTDKPEPSAPVPDDDEDAPAASATASATPAASAAASASATAAASASATAAASASPSASASAAEADASPAPTDTAAATTTPKPPAAPAPKPEPATAPKPAAKPAPPRPQPVRRRYKKPRPKPPSSEPDF